MKFFSWISDKIRS